MEFIPYVLSFTILNPMHLNVKRMLSLAHGRKKMANFRAVKFDRYKILVVSFL